MTQLIFTNLAIHRFWNPGLVTSPLLHDTFVNLGYFLSGPKSAVVVDPSFSVEFHTFLERHKVRGETLLRVQAFSAAEKWAAAIVEQISSIGGPSQFLFSGISAVEMEITAKLAAKSPPPVALETYRYLNRKSTLQKFAEELGLRMPPTDEGPYLLKPDLGQSGAGQMVSAEVPTEFLKKSARLTGDSGNKSTWFLQKFIEVKHNLSVFGENGVVLGAFQVFYDSRRASNRHVAIHGNPELTAALEQATEAYLKLALHLKTEFNYTGPFGIDALVSSEGTVFPAVDLNVRLDKSRMLFEAAKHFSIPAEKIQSHSLKFKDVGVKDFTEWWSRRQLEGGLNPKGESPKGRYIYPYLISDSEVHFFSEVNF